VNNPDPPNPLDWLFVCTLDVGCWMLDVLDICWMVDVKCWMLDVECWMSDVGCRMLDAGTMQAVLDGTLDSVRLLLGIRPNRRSQRVVYSDPDEPEPTEGFTALHFASRMGRLDVVR